MLFNAYLRYSMLFYAILARESMLLARLGTAADVSRQHSVLTRRLPHAPVCSQSRRQSLATLQLHVIIFRLRERCIFAASFDRDERIHANGSCRFVPFEDVVSSKPMNEKTPPTSLSATGWSYRYIYT